jgi:hypothetical protein
MQTDPRDRLELLKFNAMEKTIGSCLRAIIRSLSKKQRSQGISPSPPFRCATHPIHSPTRKAVFRSA